jgi:hypothetical protein
MGGLMNGYHNQLTREAHLMRGALQECTDQAHTTLINRDVAGGGAGRGRKLLAERCRGSGVCGQSLGVWLCVYATATNDLLTKGGLLSGPPRDSSVTAGMHACTLHNAHTQHTPTLGLARPGRGRPSGVSSVCKCATHTSAL